MKKAVAILLLLSNALWGQTTLSVSSAPSGAVSSNISTQIINGTYNVGWYTGADFGAKAAACMTDVEALGGGTCDGRALYGVQTAANSLTVGDGTHKVGLILPAGTITFAAGKQLIFHAYSTITGQGTNTTNGKGTTIICTTPTSAASCVQSSHEASNQLYSAQVSNFSINSTGAIGAGSIGLQIGGNGTGTRTGFSDVLESDFSDISIGNFDTGTMIDSVGGCNCYNTFNRVSSTGKSYGVQALNDSGYFSGNNSDQWNSGRLSGPIGLLDSGSGKFTYNFIDMESNTNSTGNILYAGVSPDNQGSGYFIGDTIRPAGGDGTAVLTVAAKSGTVVTGFTITTAGTTYTNAKEVATTTLTGSGSGLKVDLRISAYMVLVSHNSVLVHNPYEEAGAGDYICGTGNMVDGDFTSSAGAAYQPTYCTGLTSQYAGPQSNFVWGAGMTPNSIGLNAGIGTPSYLAMNSDQMWDGYLDNKTYNINNGYIPPYTTTTININLWADGPAWSGYQSWIYGQYGHSTWNTGLSKPHAGTIATGKTTYSQIANPSAPTLTAVGGTGTTSSKYGLVCNDYNGGTTLPAAPVTTVSGPATLGALLTIAVSNGGSGYVSGDVGSTFTIDAGANLVGSAGVGTITSVAGGKVTGVSLTTAGQNYNTLPQPGGSYSAVFTTTGGTGTGLTVSATSSYIQITYPGTDGCNSWVVLVDDTVHKLPGFTGNLNGSTSAGLNIIDFGNGTVAYTPGSRNTTADFSTTGYVQFSGITGYGTAGVVHSDTSGNLSQSLVVAADAPTLAVIPVNGAMTSATGGSGTGTITCLTASCTNISGTYSIVGGTFTTGNLLVLVWPTTTAVYKCETSQNGGVATYGIGHTVATATGMTITAGISVLGITTTIDYRCSQY